MIKDIDCDIYSLNETVQLSFKTLPIRDKKYLMLKKSSLKLVVAWGKKVPLDSLAEIKVSSDQQISSFCAVQTILK